MGHHHHVVHFSDCDADWPENCNCEERRYWLVLGVAVLILLGEIVGGWLSNSLALWSDAGHVFTDGTSMFVSIVVARHVRTHSHDEHEIRSRGFYINVALLLFVALAIAWHAYERWHEPREVEGWTMLIVAACGGVGNWVQHKILSDNVHNKTSHVLDTHILADLATSFGVVLGGVVILITNMHWVDTIVSACIAIWILSQVISLIRNPDGHHHHH